MFLHLVGPRLIEYHMYYMPPIDGTANGECHASKNSMHLRPAVCNRIAISLGHRYLPSYRTWDVAGWGYARLRLYVTNHDGTRTLHDFLCSWNCWTDIEDTASVYPNSGLHWKRRT